VCGLFLLFLPARPGIAGPLALGGDDLTDHGSYSGGMPVLGWHYIQVVLSQMLAPGAVTRPGNDGSIAALGTSFSTVTASNAGGAIHYTAEVTLGKTVHYYDGKPAIDGFFAALASGAVNPAVIWIAGTDADNDEDTDEVAAINLHAEDLRLFLNSGGGVFSHGYLNYGWLNTVLPGVTEVPGCDSSGALLTSDGHTAYPGLADADLKSGPCHTHLEGSFGSLKSLAFDGTGHVLLLGGFTATIPPPTVMQATPEGACCGYRFTTLVSGIESDDFGIGPLGVLPVADGYLVTVAAGGQLIKLLGHSDAQSRSAALNVASYGDADAAGIALLDNQVYLTQQASGSVIQINPANGAILRLVASMANATGIAAFPPIYGSSLFDQLFVSQAGGPPNAIFQVNPSLPSGSAASIFNPDAADGLMFTQDGSLLFTAGGAHINIYDTATGALITQSPTLCLSTDGVAIGEDKLAGKAYVNCNNGEVWEWQYDPAAIDNCPKACPAGPVRKIATGGSRGDFIAVDRFVAATPGGVWPSLLFTQTDSIVRMGYLDPHIHEPQFIVEGDGGWFGPPDPRRGLVSGTADGGGSSGQRKGKICSQ